MKCNKLQYLHVHPKTKQPSEGYIVGHLVCCLLGILSTSCTFNCPKCSLQGHLVKRMQSNPTEPPTRYSGCAGTELHQPRELGSFLLLNITV